MYVVQSLEMANQENNEFASSFVSSMVQQLLKYMICYKQPLEKMLLWKSGGFQDSKMDKLLWKMDGQLQAA
jgi:hypothetical protein